MKKLTLLALVAALLCGLLVYVYLNSMQQTVEETRQAEQTVDTVQVVVAVQDIPRYTDITADMVTMRDFPAAYVPAAAATSLEDVIGKQSDGTIYTDEILFTTGLATGEELGSAMSSRIPDGMRAMSIELTSAQGVDGYLEVGDYVDVLLYIPTNSSGDEGDTDTGYSDAGDTVTTNSGIIRSVGSSVTVTVPLLEGVEIAALGAKTASTDENTLAYSEVTLFLTPEQCAALLAASQNGTLALSLRQTGDNENYYTGSVTFTEQIN